MRPMQLQLDALRQRLRALDRVVVAFSGGADSAFLAWVAHHTLGPDRSLAVTAVSPSLPGAERADCAQLAAEWGLRWREVETDEPAAACLASRLPYGTPVTLQRLATVERAEAGLRGLGFAEVRVRHYDDTARLEVPVGRLADVVAARDRVVATVHAAGYRYVTLDLEGLRSGNLNAALGLVASD